MSNDTRSARTDGPSWDRVMSDLQFLVDRDYKTCQYAALVVHVGDGMPDLRIPLTPRPSGGDPSPS